MAQKTQAFLEIIASFAPFASLAFTFQMTESHLIQRIRQICRPLAPLPTATASRLSRVSGIKAVLFDVYGTLFLSGSGDISLASEMSNGQALADALRSAGMRGRLDDAGIRGSAALREAILRTHQSKKATGATFPEVDIVAEWRAVLEELRANGLIDGAITPERARRVSVEYECRVNPVWPMPGILETLTGLREHRITLGIVSNAQFYTPLMFPALLNQTLGELGFAPELCAWSFELGEAKPSTALFHAALEPLRSTCGMLPEETLFVGNDMRNDIWAAAQCGVKTVLFAGDRRSLRLREDDPRCAILEPDAVITALPELLAIC